MCSQKFVKTLVGLQFDLVTAKARSCPIRQFPPKAAAFRLLHVFW